MEDGRTTARSPFACFLTAVGQHVFLSVAQCLIHSPWSTGANEAYASSAQGPKETILFKLIFCPGDRNQICIKGYLEEKKLEILIAFLEEPNIEILHINPICIWKLFFFP